MTKTGSLKQNKQLCFTWNDGHITNAKEKIIISLLLEGNVRFLSSIHSSCSLALLFPSGSIWKVSAALTSSLHFEMHGNNSDTLFTRLNNNGWCDTIRHTLSHQTSRSLKSSCDSTAHTPPHVKFVFTRLSSILLESLITKSFKVKPPRDKMKMILVRETAQPQKYTLQHSQKKNTGKLAGQNTAAAACWFQLQSVHKQ